MLRRRRNYGKQNHWVKEVGSRSLVEGTSYRLPVIPIAVGCCVEPGWFGAVVVVAVVVFAAVPFSAPGRRRATDR